VAHKVGVVERALQTNKTRLDDPLRILAALGGFEIAGICGLALGGAASRVPVVVDGFISSAGALAACRLDERVKDYLFFSHLSQERGHRAFVERFGVDPILDLQMHLGEGTGAALAMSVIRASVRIYNEMASFRSAGVSGKD
jgi:nicotinate-nucleotide--dimethylbenzimidazole phosphoribosyltransferase